MKHLLLISCLFCFLLIAHSQEKSNYISITANLPNWDSTYITIEEEGINIYSDSVLNGHFKYSGRIKGTKEGNLIIQKNRLVIRLPIYLESGNIFIKDSAKNLIKFEIFGTRLNDSLLAFQNRETKLFSLYNVKTKEDYNAVLKKRNLYATNYIRQHNNLLSCLTVFRKDILDFDQPIEERINIFNSLSKEIKQSYGGKGIYKNLLAILNTAEGRICPDFTQTDVAGKKLNLKNFRGKYILLDFWASWCQPCRAENPELKRIYSLYKENNFEIVSISLDSDRKLWLSAIEKDELPWIHLSDLNGWKNSAATQFYIEAIPANFLIDPKGIIMGKNLSTDDLEKKLNSIFNMK